MGVGRALLLCVLAMTWTGGATRRRMQGGPGPVLVPPSPAPAVPPSPGPSISDSTSNAPSEGDGSDSSIAHVTVTPTPPPATPAPTKATDKPNSPEESKTTDAASADSDSGDDSSASVMVLGVSLAALLLGNVLCAGWCFMRNSKKRQAPPLIRRDPSADAELGRLQRDLEAEHNRRVRAEALIHRSKGGGIRPSEFPSVRDVDTHVEQLADDALAWSERACSIGGSHAALPATIKSVLENTFIVCREEVERCLDERLQNLSAFLGNEEPVLLSAEESMNLDTQYVLYECLCKNFKSIVPTDPEHMEELASVVHRRCGNSADRTLGNKVIFGESAWPSFDALMKHYILVFVEMALQKPRMDVGDSLGNQVPFEPRIHRDWAPYFKTPVGQKCSIVFPAVRPVRGRPTANVKIGVVRVPSN